MKAYASRSQVLSYQECPRRRYFAYEIPTSNPSLGGIRLSRLDMNLHTGSCYHAGMEALNRGKSVEEAVGLALEEFWPKCKAQGLILEDNEDASYVAYEQAAMVEALIRAYAIAILPGNLERFDIVEVETEDVGLFQQDGFDLHFGARLDSLLIEKSTQDLYIQNFKTTKEWGKKSDDSTRHDMQGLSETAVVDQRMERWHNILETVGNNPHSFSEPIPNWFVIRWLTGASPYVFGVRMEFALKGRRSESPRGSGRYVYSNPLIRPWKKADDLKSFGGKAGNYAFKFEFQDELGGNHRLGKGWNSVNIWEDMGVKNWIDLLASETIQGFLPMTALTNQFVLPEEYYRSEEDIERWKRQVIGQERKITEAKKEIALGAVGGVIKLPRTFETLEAAIDEHFPMHTRSCDWPTKCVYQPICFGPKPYLVAPESSGLYSIREANHPTEVEFNQGE
jgi:hypothetical protein